MNVRFADTSFYLALINNVDDAHERASQLARGWTGLVVTTEYVLIELANWLSHSGNRPVFVRLLQSLMADPKTRVVESSHELYLAASRSS